MSLKITINKILNLKYNMSWPAVIIYSIIVALATAVILIVPVLNRTGFSYIGVTPEAWFIFALIVIINCNSALEAALKTFVFFLISQPLIYLFQVPFYIDGFGIFMYYPRWFILTLLTFPGAAIAYQIKKKNVLSVCIFLVAGVYVALYAIWLVLYQHEAYVYAAVLLLMLFLIIRAVFDLNKQGIIVIILSLALGFGGAAYMNTTDMSKISAAYELDEDHQWKSAGNANCAYELKDNRLEVFYTMDGEYYVDLENEKGEIVRFKVVLKDKTISIKQDANN